MPQKPKSATNPTAYDAKSIQLLKGLEAVRSRDHITAFFLQQCFGCPADGLAVINDHHAQSGEATLVLRLVHSHLRHFCLQRDLWSHSPA